MLSALKYAGTRLLDLQYLGFGFWQAWSMLCYTDGFLSTGTTALSLDLPLRPSLTSLLFLICSLTLTISIVALTSLKRTDSWLKSGWFPAIGAVLGVASTVTLCMAAAFQSCPSGVLYTACAVVGVSNAMLCLSYAPIIGEQPPERSFLQVCYAMIISCVIYFIAVGAPFVMKCALCTACPLVSGLLPALGNLKLQQQDREEALQRLALSAATWRLFVAVFVLAAAASLIRSPLLVSTYTNSETGWVGLGTFIVLVVCAALVLLYDPSKKLRIDTMLYYPASIIVIVFLLASSVQSIGQSITLTSLASAPRVLLNVAFDAIFFCIIYQSKMSPAKIMGMGHGLKSLGILLGGLAGITLVPTDETRIVFYSIMVFVVVIAIVLIAPDRVFAAVFTPIDDQDLENLPPDAPDAVDVASAPDANDAAIATDAEQGKEPAGAKTGTLGEAGEEGAGTQRTRGKRLWHRRCNLICERYDLSPREQEVLYLLSLGHGSKYISEQLVISLYTARTHTRNIYAKTDVHSREELIQLVKHTEVEEW